MKDLHELAATVSAYRLKKLDILDPAARPDENPYTKITRALARGEVYTDKEAAAQAGLAHPSGSFRMFKLRLKEKLLNSLLFLDLNPRNTNPYMAAGAACSRNQHAVRVLLIIGARQTAVQIAQQSLPRAEEYQLYRIAAYFAKVLRSHNSLEGDHKAYLKYNDLHVRYSTLAFDEEMAASCMEEINALSVNKATTDEKMTDTAKRHLESIKNIITRSPTYQVSLFYYRIKALNESLALEFKNELQTWKGFDGLITKYRHFEPKTRFAESGLHQMVCYLHLRDYPQGAAYARKCEVLFPVQNNNWFVFKEYFYLLTLHTHRYDDAGRTLQTVMQQPRFVNQPVNRQERWRILEAYYYFVMKAAARALPADEKRQKNEFIFSRFFKEITIHTKDKTGYNLSLLILEIMLLFLEGHFDLITNKIHNLKSYEQRYMSKTHNSKSRLFVKMLCKTEPCNFNRDETEKKTAALAEKLKSPDFALSPDLDGLEIIPFEDLWDIVLKCLD